MFNMHVLINEELKKEADKKAESLGLSLSAYVRMLIIKDLKEEK